MSTPETRTSDAATYLGTLDCVHCGLCIEHCPSYRVTGRESASPRGRVYTMRALLEGRLEVTPDLVEDLESCLLCRACESACPSGVPYAEVATTVRAGMRKRGPFRRLLMDGILIRPRRLAFFVGFTGLLQRLGLLALSSRLPGKLGSLAAAAPTVPPRSERKRLEASHPAVGEEKGCVAFLEGCVMGELFGAVNRAAVDLLQAAGYRVEVPQDQGCCGALHEHDGALDIAHDLARKNARAFDDEKYLAIVNDSAGCGAFCREAERHFPDDEAARRFSQLSVDFSRFLVENGERLRFEPQELRFSYDAPCHLHHAQKETSAPLELLSRVPGFTHVPLPGAERCCGAAGIYNLDHPEIADAVLDEKLDALASLDVELLVSGNPGCLMQWRKGIARRGLRIRAEHPAVILREQLRG